MKNLKSEVFKESLYILMKIRITLKCTRALSSKKIMPEGMKELEHLIEENKKNITKVNSNLIRIVSNIDILKLAYHNIMSNPGNMTIGTDNETLNGINEKWFEKIQKELNTGAFKFKPYIPKGNGKARPLGIPSTRDKIVQEVMKLILEAIYEPTFLDNSHGYRPEKSCHSAMKYIKRKNAEMKWFVKGDISKSFELLDYKIIINILSIRIKDQVFMDLIYKALKTGYIDITKIGRAQGSIISPILCNIYLHKLDVWMKNYVEIFKKGTKRRPHTEEPKHDNVVRKLKGIELAKKSLYEPIYRRLTYVRYGEEFIIGAIASRDECVTIRSDLQDYLKKELKLELNLDNTKITNGSKDRANFIGYEIHIEKGKDNKIIKKTRSKISVPISMILKKINDIGYCKGKNNNPTRVGRLIHYTNSFIVNHFATLWRGFANYYSISTNFTALHQIYYILYYSCVLTLASKLKLKSKRKVLNQFGKDLRIYNNKGTTLAYFPKWGKPKETCHISKKVNIT